MFTVLTVSKRSSQMDQCCLKVLSSLPLGAALIVGIISLRFLH